MAVFLIILAAVVAVGAFVLYQRGLLGGTTDSGQRESTTGRLHQRVEDARGQSDTTAGADDPVDSRAAVWDESPTRSADPDDLFADDVPVVEPRPSAREEFFDDLPYAEDDDDEEPIAVERPGPRTPVVTPTLVVLDENEDVDRFAPRSSYVPGLAEEDEE